MNLLTYTKHTFSGKYGKELRLVEYVKVKIVDSGSNTFIEGQLNAGNKKLTKSEPVVEYIGD